MSVKQYRWNTLQQLDLEENWILVKQIYKAHSTMCSVTNGGQDPTKTIRGKDCGAL